jgi:quercetin dioxygenase-like cupin family protein
MSQTADSRLRPHPVDRFEAEEHYFDLRQAAAKLQNEPHPPQEGHRQIALYHYGSVTIVLFVFEAGSRLPEHVAEGLETIHALEGGLTVRSAGQTYELSSGSLLVINPGVSRSIEARNAARLLLTVHLGGEKTLDSPRRPEAMD